MRDLRGGIRLVENSDLVGNQRLQQNIGEIEPKEAAKGIVKQVWGGDGILGVEPNQAVWPQQKV